MIFSLIVAFIVTPWTAYKLMRKTTAHSHQGEDRFTRTYRYVMDRLIANPKQRWVYLTGVAVLLLVGAPLLIRQSILPQPLVDDSHMVEYRNPTLGFSQLRPEPWTVVEDHPQLIPKGQDTLHAVAFVPNPDSKTLAITYVQTLTTTQTLQEYAAQQRADLQKDTKVPFTELRPVKITLDLKGQPTPPSLRIGMSVIPTILVTR